MRIMHNVCRGMKLGMQDQTQSNQIPTKCLLQTESLECEARIMFTNA